MPMDMAICDAYVAQHSGVQVPAASPPRSIYDLPIARAVYEADRRQFGSKR